MGYCKEYFDWVNSNVQSTFSIAETSIGMIPGDVREVACEGFGFIKLFKEDDGDLKLIYEDGSSRRYVDVKHQYVPR